MTSLPPTALHHLCRYKRQQLPPGFKVKGATGQPFEPVALVKLDFYATERGRHFSYPVLIVKGLPSGAILGHDFMRDYDVHLHAATNTISFGAEELVDAARRQYGSQIFAESPMRRGATVAEVQEGQEERDQSHCVHGQERICGKRGRNSSSSEGSNLPRVRTAVDAVMSNVDEVVNELDAGTYTCTPTELTTEKWHFLRQSIKHHFQGKDEIRFWDMVRRHHDAFSKNPFDLGRTDAIKHHIRLKTKDPIHVKQFPIAWAHQQAVNEHVSELLHAGCIQPSRSAYNSPIFAVKKKSGELRIVQDMRMVNANSYEDKYCMREISNCLDQIGINNSKVFSSLDLTAGYWQMDLAEDSRDCTAFTVPGRGRFCWTTTTQGLHGAPASFARLMDHVTQGVDGVICYLDDCLAHSADTASHLDILEKLLTRFQVFNLKLNPTKCAFAAPRIPYLGFMLTKSGVEPGEDKLKEVRDFPPPRTHTAIREFTGLVNYFRHFVPNQARLCGYMTNLLKGKAN